MPPMRDNYGNMRIVKTAPINDEDIKQKDPDFDKIFNYYSTTSNTFIFQNYKNAFRLGQLRFRLKEVDKRIGDGKKLIRIIKDSLKNFKRDFLFTPITKPNKMAGKMMKRLGQISKKYGLGKFSSDGEQAQIKVLRRMYITHMYREKKLDTDEKDTLAFFMAHSQKTAQTVYLRQLQIEDEGAPEDIPNT